jgi:CxxC-x17-CxxC domain-containing protein
MGHMKLGKSFGGGRIAAKKFDNDRGGWGRRDDRGGERKEMFDAVCSECGNRCQVPFRPNGRKPVLCSNCYGKSEMGTSRFDRSSGGVVGSRRQKARARDRGALAPRAMDGNPNQLQEISDKLDVILALLQDEQDL